MKWLAVFGHWDAFSHTPNCGRGLNHWTLNFAQFWPGFLKRVDSEDIVVDFETSFRLRRNGDKTIPGLKHSFWQWTQCQRLLTRGCVNLIVNCKLTRGCVRSIYKWIKSHHHGRLLIAGQVKTIHLSCLISQQLGRRSFSHQSEDCKFSGQDSPRSSFCVDLLKYYSSNSFEQLCSSSGFVNLIQQVNLWENTEEKLALKQILASEISF